MSSPTESDRTHQHPALEPLAQVPRGQASILIELAGELRAVKLRAGSRLVLGRSEPADVVVEHPSVSRAHAQLTLEGNHVVVEDLGSTNGVVRDGQRVARAELRDGESVALGAVVVTVTGLQPAPSSARLRPSSDFRQAVLAEVERARTFERPFSLLGLRIKQPQQEGFRFLVQALRPVDTASLHTPDLAMVLLPETPARLGLEIANRFASSPAAPACAVATFPDDGADFETLTERLVHSLRAPGTASSQRVTAPASRASADGAVVASEVMRRIYALVGRVARTPLPVLVLGETGVGKELIAHAVHEASPRAKGPFVAINCATIPPNLIESVLFGHERGSFTGAAERHLGVFERGSGGSVFLDEVGELSPNVQAALLRVLETKRILRVGSTKEIELDLRVIAATHRSLPALVASGTFREDLMFRLDALSLQVPPLRERRAEIEPLAERFLRGAREQWAATAERFSQAASEALVGYAWPGNVRQLKNVVERAAVLCTGQVIELDDLPEALLSAPAASENSFALEREPTQASSALAAEQDGSSEAAAEEGSFEASVQDYERRIIREALAKTGGNQSKAAQLLKLPRRTLTHKIHALGLSRAR